MNKAEIIEKLAELKIEHDPSATKAELLALLPQDAVASEKGKTVKVVAQRQLSEPTGSHKKGETFETTPARVKALGGLVKPASD